MRTIPVDLAAEFADGATTLCRCWKVERRDGAIFGFTDHDRDLTFAGVTFQAQSGLEAAEAEAALGLAVNGGEVSGALSSVGISEDEVSRGLWDGATVDTWLVDWRDVTRRMLLDSGEIGEIRRQGDAFSAELRGLAHQLDQQQGRRYIARCDAVLGDARCGVSLATGGRQVTAVIASVVDAATFTVTAPGTLAPGSLAGGLVAFASGANMGTTRPVMAHGRAGVVDRIGLWSPPSLPLATGDQVLLTVGCDKSFTTCRDRFQNALNFRGFPHIPGNDFAMAYARQGEAGQDGGAVTP